MRKEATTLSPLARQTARDTSPMFRGGLRSLMQFATVRAPEYTVRLAICTDGDECGATADDIQHQLFDFKPGTEECLFDALPVVIRD